MARAAGVLHWRLSLLDLDRGKASWLAQGQPTAQGGDQRDRRDRRGGLNRQPSMQAAHHECAWTSVVGPELPNLIGKSVSALPGYFRPQLAPEAPRGGRRSKDPRAR